MLFDEVGFTWTVADTNRAPVVVDPGDQSDAEGDVVSLAVVGSDPDRDTLTWSAAGLPDGLSIDPGTGVISGTLPFDAFGAVHGDDHGHRRRVTEPAYRRRSSPGRSPTPTGRRWWPTRAISPMPRAMWSRWRWSGSDPDLDTLTWSAVGLPAGPVDRSASRRDLGDAHLRRRRVACGDGAGDRRRGPGAVRRGRRSPGRSPTPTGRRSWWTRATSPMPRATWSRWRCRAPIRIGTPSPGRRSGLPAGLSIDPASGVISGTLAYTAAGSHLVTVTATDDGRRRCLPSGDHLGRRRCQSGAFRGESRRSGERRRRHGCARSVWLGSRWRWPFVVGNRTPDRSVDRPGRRRDHRICCLLCGCVLTVRRSSHRDGRRVPESLRQWPTSLGPW